MRTLQDLVNYITQKGNQMNPYRSLEDRVADLERRVGGESFGATPVAPPVPEGISFKNSPDPASRSIYILRNGERVGRIRRRGGCATPPSNGELVGFTQGTIKSPSFSLDELEQIVEQMAAVLDDEE